MASKEVSDLKKQNAELRYENKILMDRIAKLEKSGNTEFLNDLSHEIRTPIQAINSISNGLVSNWEEFDEETNFQLAKKISSNSQRLFSLIDNVLEIPYLKEGKVNLKYSRILIEDLIEDLVWDFKKFYLDNNDIDIQIVSKINQDTILLGDRERIIQIVRNLLTNALKICSIGKIIIQLNYKNDYVEISVIDEGIGIPEEEINNLFNQEGKTSNTKDHTTGIGVGLLVCKCLIEAHKGRIWAQNNSGPGARISFTLPIPDSYKKKMHESKTKSKSPISSQNLVKDISPEKDLDTSKAVIVAVDDEDACLLSISMMLMKTNYELKLYSNPIEALDYLKMAPNKPDLVLLDVMMPELDGLKFLKNMQYSNKLKNIPTLMQSGVADMSQINQALSLGAKDFIRKPYSKDILLESIENNLRAKK